MSTIPVWMFVVLLVAFCIGVISLGILITMAVTSRLKKKQQRAFEDEKKKDTDPKKPKLKLSFEYELRLAQKSYESPQKVWSDAKIIAPTKEMYGQLKYGIRPSGVWGITKFTLMSVGYTSTGEIYFEAGDDVLEIRKDIEKLKKEITDQEIEFEMYSSLERRWKEILEQINNLKVIERKVDEQEKAEVK